MNATAEYHSPMRFVWMIPAAFIGVSGCALPGQRADFESPDPAERTLAVGHAAADPDPATIPELIRLLESEDPAERMLAIRALEKQTGQTLGYEYAATEPSRQEAVKRWVAWERGQRGKASGGAGPASPGQ